VKIVDASEVPAKVKRFFKRNSSEDRGAADPTPAPHKKWRTKLAHPSFQIVGDECPNCGFPEAEGGYCEECGWTLPPPFNKRR
jgi:hypothetical protein